MFDPEKVAVPISTYKRIGLYQYGHGLSRCPETGERRILMRGCWGIRAQRRGSIRHYGTDVLHRYIRRLKVTETDPDKWQDWVRYELMPIFRTRFWWSYQRSCQDDINTMVCAWSVVILGERHILDNEDVIANVRKLRKGAAKIIGQLPRLPVAVPNRKVHK